MPVNSGCSAPTCNLGWYMCMYVRVCIYILKVSWGEDEDPPSLPSIYIILCSSAVISLFQDEDQEDDYKSADDQVTSNIEDLAAESVDYSEEAGLPVEEAVRGEPATEEHHFMTINTETGIIPDSEINQHTVMVAPPSVITQSTMMRYVLQLLCVCIPFLFE